MKKLRPLAGLLLATLVFTAAAGAAEVERLLPGGATELTKQEPDLSASVELIPSRPDRSSDSHSSDAEPTLQTRHFGSQIELSCAIGDPTDAIVVVNHSDEPLPAGTRIKWQLKAEGLKGFFRLLGTLGGGETLVADNVLDSRVDRNAACVARVI